MMNKNKNSISYDITAVSALVIADFKWSVMIVSLLTNLTVLVSWMVVSVG